MASYFHDLTSRNSKVTAIHECVRQIVQRVDEGISSNVHAADQSIHALVDKILYDHGHCIRVRYCHTTE
jgi:hypothetical protein